MPLLVSLIAAGCAGTDGKNVLGTVDSGLATVGQTAQTRRAGNEAPPTICSLNCKYMVLRISISCKKVSLSILINDARFVFESFDAASHKSYLWTFFGIRYFYRDYNSL
jgi:hypothetical protein